MFTLLTLLLRSDFWGRAALLAGPVALAAALALSGLEITGRETSAWRCSRSSAPARPRSQRVTRSRLVLAGALLAIFVVYALVLAFSPETSSLAALGPHPDGGVRFYGISNQVETLLLVPGLLGAALLGAALVPVVAVLVLIVVGASGLGADGGGVLVFAAGYLFLWLRLRRVPLSFRNVALAAGAASSSGSFSSASTLLSGDRATSRARSATGPALWAASSRTAGGSRSTATCRPGRRP